MLRSLFGGKSKREGESEGGEGGGIGAGGGAEGFRDKRRGERVTAARKALDTALEMLNDPANLIDSVGIARKEVVTKVEQIVLAAVQTLEECELAKALSREEQRDMERLKGHELGAKADPAKFKRVYTEDKKFALFQYKLRVEISQQIRNTNKVLKVAQVSGRASQKPRQGQTCTHVYTPKNLYVATSRDIHKGLRSALSPFKHE